MKGMDSMQTKTFHIIQDNEFDKLVEDNLDLDYECVAEGEWDNDSSYTFNNVKKNDYATNLWKNDLEDAIEKKNLNGISPIIILEYLVGKDILPEGNYIIETCW